MDSVAGRNVGLDGVVEQQENYRKSGFELAYSNVRFEGVTCESQPLSESVAEIGAEQFDTVLGYDASFFPSDRCDFLKRWLVQEGSVPLGAWAENALVGYGVIRPCQSGFKVGPLFADSPKVAEELFQGLQSSVRPDEPLYLDIPEGNKQALSLVQQYGMSKVFETARMYTGEFPKLPLGRLYGVTSFELG